MKYTLCTFSDPSLHNGEINYAEQLFNRNEKSSHCYADDDSIYENDTINELERTAI